MSSQKRQFHRTVDAGQLHHGTARALPQPLAPWRPENMRPCELIRAAPVRSTRPTTWTCVSARSFWSWSRFVRRRVRLVINLLQIVAGRDAAVAMGDQLVQMEQAPSINNELHSVRTAAWATPPDRFMTMWDRPIAL